MKIQITFDDKDDDDAMNSTIDVLNTWKYKNALYETDIILRTAHKYENLTEDQAVLVTRIRDAFIDITGGLLED